MKTNVSSNNNNKTYRRAQSERKANSRRVAVLLQHHDQHVDITTVFASGHWVTDSYPSSEEALAAIQCPENHHVPAFLDGYPTVINAWLEQQRISANIQSAQAAGSEGASGSPHSPKLEGVS